MIGKLVGTKGEGFKVLSIEWEKHLVPYFGEGVNVVNGQTTCTGRYNR